MQKLPGERGEEASAEVRSQTPIKLSDGWFLLGWWLFAVGGGWLSGRIRGALELPGDRDTASRESVSPYDVAFLRAGSNWAGDAALFSLLHAGVVRVDEDGKLRRGPKPLPDDAPEIERYVLERAAGLDAKSTPEVVLARAWTHHVERLQRLGLLPSRSVGLASRFAQGCVLAAIAVVAMTWLRHNAAGLSDHRTRAVRGPRAAQSDAPRRAAAPLRGLRSRGCRLSPVERGLPVVYCAARADRWPTTLATGSPQSS